MSYEKTVWNPGAAPGISADNLNNIELGIERTHARSMTTTERNDLSGADLFAGRVIYNTTTNLMNVYTGSAWVEVAEIHGNEKHDPNMATASDLTSHEGDTTNPHSVTASQANAAPDSHDNANHSPNYSAEGHAHSTLTPGTGISGSNYNGTAARTFSLAAHNNTHHSTNYASDADLTSHEGETADSDNVHGLRDNKVIIGNGSAGAGTDATAVGRNASAGGSYSTALGRLASAQGMYSTALGRGATADVANTIRIGDSAVDSIGGYQDWSNVSDERDKVDIESSEYGLNIITKLNPIKYRLDPRKRYEEKDDDGKVTKHKKDGSKANENYSYGFSAQELVEALKDTDLDIVDDADPDQLAVREGKLVPVLVKAVQELAAEVERLKEAK